MVVPISSVDAFNTGHAICLSNNRMHRDLPSTSTTPTILCDYVLLKVLIDADIQLYKVRSSHAC